MTGLNVQTLGEGAAYLASLSFGLVLSTIHLLGGVSCNSAEVSIISMSGWIVLHLDDKNLRMSWETYDIIRETRGV